MTEQLEIRYELFDDHLKSILQDDRDFSHIVGEVYSADGKIEDLVYYWETAINFAANRKIRILQGDGHLSRQELQDACDRERELHIDCFGY